MGLELALESELGLELRWWVIESWYGDVWPLPECAQHNYM